MPGPSLAHLLLFTHSTHTVFLPDLIGHPTGLGASVDAVVFPVRETQRLMVHVAG